MGQNKAIPLAAILSLVWKGRIYSADYLDI
jgi:hypothetical protein